MHRVLRQIDVHIPLERAVFEPVQDVYRGFVEGQSDLVRKANFD